MWSQGGTVDQQSPRSHVQVMWGLKLYGWIKPHIVLCTSPIHQQTFDLTCSPTASARTPIANPPYAPIHRRPAAPRLYIYALLQAHICTPILILAPYTHIYTLRIDCLFHTCTCSQTHGALVRTLVLCSAPHLFAHLKQSYDSHASI